MPFAFEASILNMIQLPAQDREVGSTTPQRRSILDLQAQIDDLFSRVAEENEDGSRICRSADLPELLRAFEERRNITLLDQEEQVSLASFAEQVRKLLYRHGKGAEKCFSEPGCESLGGPADRYTSFYDRSIRPDWLSNTQR